MQKLVFINGNGEQIDLTAGNFGITNWEGFSNTELNIQTQQVPFEDGGVFLDALMEQREIAVTVAIYDGSNLELRYQKKRELISALNPKLGEGTLIYTNDYLSRQIKAVPQIPLFENKNSNDAGTLKANVAFSCPSPYWEDVEETLVQINKNETKVINNNGDVNIGFNINLQVNEGKNITLSNKTTNKRIKLNGNINNNVLIDTELGQKKILATQIKSKLLTNLSGECSFCYSKHLNKYCIVGNGVVLFDENYNYEIEPSSQIFRDVCYSEDLQLFCAVGNTLSTSIDGKTWLNITTIEGVSFYKVCYSTYFEKFIAIGKSITGSSGRYTGYIYISENGETWELAYSELLSDNNSFQNIAIDNINGIVCVLVSNCSIMRSTDLENWTNIVTFYRSGQDICYSEELQTFILVGNNYDAHATAYIMKSSDDGLTWTTVYSDYENNKSFYLYAVTYSKDAGYFIATGNLKNYISYDGSIWITSNERETNLNIKNIKYYNGFLYGMGEKFYYSTDLLNWEVLLDYPSSVKKCCYFSKKNIYVGIEGNSIKISNDGRTWETVYTDEYSLSSVQVLVKRYYVQPNYITEEKVYICGGTGNGGGNGCILSSADGVNWDREYLSGKNCKCITIFSMYYILGTTHGVYYKQWTASSQTWYKANLSSDISVASMTTGIVNGQNRIAVAGESQLYVSGNGTNWSYFSYGAFTINTIRYITEKKFFIAVGTNGRVYKSVNLQNWKTIASGSVNDLITFKETEYNGFVIAGKNGTIIKTLDFNEFYIITDGLLPDSTTFTDFLETKKGVIIGIGSVAIEIQSLEKDNYIDKADSQSTLFDIKRGNNIINLSSEEGFVSGILSYRQKYIGV